MILIIRFYKIYLSPFFHAFVILLTGQSQAGCKFEPTCSEYFTQAIKKHGYAQGSLKGISRVCRCHPFSKKEGYDPV